MNDSLHNAIQAADGALNKQEQQVETLKEQQVEKRQHQALLFPLIVLAVCAAIMVYRFPRVMAPYEWPAADSEEVVEADLFALVTAIQVHEMVSGQNPVSLEAVQLSEGLSELVKQNPPRYTRQEDGFVVEWDQPKWHTSYNSHTRHLQIDRKKP